MMIKKDRDEAAPHQEQRASADREQQALDVLRTELRAIQRSYASLPVLDDRPADEILGYDEHGLPP